MPCEVFRIELDAVKHSSVHLFSSSTSKKNQQTWVETTAAFLQSSMNNLVCSFDCYPFTTSVWTSLACVLSALLYIFQSSNVFEDKVCWKLQDKCT